MLSYIKSHVKDAQRMESRHCKNHVVVRGQQPECLDMSKIVSEINTIEQAIEAIESDDHKIGLMINLLNETLGIDGMHLSAIVMLKLVRHMALRNFQLEEKIMFTYDFYGIINHTKEHYNLLSYIDGLIYFLDTANDAHEIDAKTVREFIGVWHAKHLSNCDGALIDYLKEINRQRRVQCQDGNNG